MPNMCSIVKTATAPCAVAMNGKALIMAKGNEACGQAVGSGTAEVATIICHLTAAAERGYDMVG